MAAEKRIGRAVGARGIGITADGGVVGAAEIFRDVLRVERREQREGLADAMLEGAAERVEIRRLIFVGTGELCPARDDGGILDRAGRALRGAVGLAEAAPVLITRREGVPHEIVCAGGGAQPRRAARDCGGRGDEGRRAVPRGERIARQRNRLHALIPADLAVGAERGVFSQAKRECKVGRLAGAADPVFPTAAGVAHEIQPGGDGGRQLAVHVERAAILVPRPDAEREAGAVGEVRALGVEVGDAARLGGAEEEGVGAFGDIDALDVVGVGGGLPDEEIAGLILRAEAAKLEGLLVVVVGGHAASAGGETRGLEEIGGVDVAQKLLREHGDGHRDVAEVLAGARARDRRHCAVTEIAIGGHFKDGHLHRVAGCGGGGLGRNGGG